MTVLVSTVEPSADLADDRESAPRTTPASDRYRRRIFDAYLSTTYAYRSGVTRESVERQAREHLSQIGRYLPEGKEDPILEIGSGNGAFLLCCKQQGYTAARGLDISPEQVRFCVDSGLEDVVCADGLSYLRDSSEEFAVIAMIDVLEHLPKNQVLDLLAEAHSHLRPGGRIILRVPNMSNPFNVRTRYVDFTHEVGFSKETLEQVLRVIGFEPEAVCGAFRTDPRWWMRLVFDVLAWRLFRIFHKRVLHLPAEVVRGKNLIAVGLKRIPDPTAP